LFLHDLNCKKKNEYADLGMTEKIECAAVINMPPRVSREARFSTELWRYSDTVAGLGRWARDVFVQRDLMALAGCTSPSASI
jgi:hypothetical protein